MAGEDPDRAGSLTGGGPPGGHARCPPALRHHGQPLTQFGGGAGDDGGTLGQVGATPGQGVPDRGERGLGVLTQPIRQLAGERAQAGLGHGRDGEDRQPFRGGRRTLRLRWCLLQDDVRDRAPDAVAGDTCPARSGELRPLLHPRDQSQPAAFPVDIRVRGTVQARRYLSLPECQHGLDDASDPRAGLDVADVRLHRADQARRAGRPTSPEHPGQGSRLLPVPDRGSGAVRLHVPDRVRGDPGPVVHDAEHVLLRLIVRRHHAVRSSILEDAAALDERQHRIAVAQRVGQPLQHHHPGSLTATVAVSGAVERLTPAVR